MCSSDLAVPAAVAGLLGGSDQSAHQTLQRRRIGRVRERVAGDVNDVLDTHLQAVEGVERVPGLGPGGEHERALGPRVRHGDAVAEVAVDPRAHVDRPDGGESGVGGLREQTALL